MPRLMNRSTPWTKTVLTFVAGCVTTGAAARLIVDVNAQSAGAAGIHVCIGADRVLRLAQGGACAAGEKSVYFQQPASGVARKPDDAGRPNPDASADQQRIAQLEQRIAELERAANRGELGNRVTAPFTVADRDGKRIFDVDIEDGAPRAQVYNADGRGVASMWGADNGGQFVARSSDATSRLATYMGLFSGGQGAGIRVMENVKTRLDLGRDPESATYRLKVFGKDGSVRAGIGENSAGTGTAQVAGTDGVVRAVLTVDRDSKGHADIYGAGAKSVAVLTEGSHASGYLALYGSNGGPPMVEAGSTADGIGVVRAGPEGFKPGLGLLGLPGSYIAGKK